MTDSAALDPLGGDPADLQAQLSRLMAALTADWLGWHEAEGSEKDSPTGEGLSAADRRARCAQGLKDLLGALGASAGNLAWAAERQGQEGGARSLVAALQALHALVEDPMASVPGHLGTALVLTQERLADLHLQQLLAAEDPNWTRMLLQPVQAASASLPEDMDPDVQPTSGSTGRDWWAIPVEGLTGSNQMFVLETRELLRSAELSFQSLKREPGDYGEQMVLCRSFQAVSVAASSMGLHRVAQFAAQGEARFDALLDRGGLCDAESLRATEDLLSGLFRELMELVGEPVAEAVAAATPPTPEPTKGPAIDFVEQPEQAHSTPAPEPEQPPWWWAMDWSAWVHPVHLPSTSTVGTEALMQVLQVATQATEAAAAVLRLPSAQLHAWADRLRAEGHDGSIRQALVDELEEASCVPLESWSVALFRTARRVAREAGQSVDFDIEGASVRADAALMQHLMPRLDEWIGLRVAQSLGCPLRLRATHAGATVHLSLGDGHPQPWPEGVMAQARDMASWLAARGGAVRADGSDWQFAMPAIATRVPLVPVRCGAFEAHLPDAWVVSRQLLDSHALGQALEAASLEHQGSIWPVTPLSALLRQESADQASAHVLHIRHGHQHLALVVDDVKPATVARPMDWPAPLAGLQNRSCMWGLAACDTQRLLLVIDPFALHARFGAAARVLARTRSRRARR